ncbi:MAG: SBBP repeat-containing protein, partial [Betaproteobacteria bacterium]|nr:SBBP repeat-containing protein [Betaproteobacteria bacterium]
MHIRLGGTLGGETLQRERKLLRGWRRCAPLAFAASSAFVAFAAFSISAAAQIPEVAWSRTLYATGNVSALVGAKDAAFAKRALTTDPAGNVYVTGTTHNGVDTDILVVKYNPLGTIVWRTTANGPARKDDVAYAIAVDGAGNVAVAGAANTGSHWDAFVFKLDANGQEVWRQTYDGGVVRDDYAYDVAFASNGDVIMTGTVGVVAFGTSSNYLTQRYLAADGAAIWSQQSDGAGQSVDRPAAMAIDNAGNVIITGFSTSASGYLEYLTVKYAGDGTFIANARSGAAGLNNIASSIATDSAGNIHVTGTSFVLGNANYLTIKYDANLMELWQS